jgi:formate hydrogenlyase subunit 3/multisubunit Na+/H+ antiporter MnhD subunit
MDTPLLNLLLLATAIMIAGGIVSLAVTRSALWATRIGAGGGIVGATLGLVVAIRALLEGSTESIRQPWPLPFASFYVEIDALSAFFLLPVFLLSALCAVYGARYLLAWEKRKLLGPPWFFYNLLIASIVFVIIARNAILFLFAWEAMTLAAYFLVAFENEKPKVREAAWTYLLATHLGTSFLLPMFVLFGLNRGTLDFDQLVNGPVSKNPGLLFVLAIIGFGTKAGFMPMHVWLPEAHPAAPTHVSALLSGVVIKTGIYGLVRTLTFLGPPQLWWGWLLIGIGLSSGILGVLFALAQHDLKRLLAYHSIENIGIIALGLGVGLLGLHAHSVPVAVLGFGGALLHVLNHALFKGLLFLGAGAVAHSTHTLEIDHLGGLLKKMPLTGAAFLVGAIAICGLPPFNGFVSEFMVYLGSLGAASSLVPASALPSFAVIAGLALIGGLATACFTKAFGAVFLGSGRSAHTEHAHEQSPAIVVPMLALAVICFLLGIGAPVTAVLLKPALVELTHAARTEVGLTLMKAATSMNGVAFGAFCLLAVISMLAVIRAWLLTNKSAQTVTWDCGYARPTARMQYSASSFAQPLTVQFRNFLFTRTARTSPNGIFPRGASFATHTPDVCMDGFYLPVFGGMRWLFSKLRWMQQGRVQIYVLYVLLTLLALLYWKLG